MKLEYISKLTPKEIEQLRKFAASPYFNSNRKVMLLSNYLCSRYPNINENTLNKKVIYRNVYRNRKFNENNC